MSNIDLSKLTAEGTTLSGQVTLNINLTSNESATEPTLDDALTIIAKEVIKGTYGSGVTRKNKIYQAVQNKVNEINK